MLLTINNQTNFLLILNNLRENQVDTFYATKSLKKKKL